MLAKDESIVARALCQLLEADMIAQGMEPKLAKALSGRACEISVVRAGKATKRGVRKATKTTRRAVSGMGPALKKANAKARKKNGSFKKGWTQARVMKEAHRLRRRM